MQTTTRDEVAILVAAVDHCVLTKAEATNKDYLSAEEKARLIEILYGDK